MSGIYILHGQYLALIHSHAKLQFFDWASEHILYKVSLFAPFSFNTSKQYTKSWLSDLSPSHQSFCSILEQNFDQFYIGQAWNTPVIDDTYTIN